MEVTLDWVLVLLLVGLEQVLAALDGPGVTLAGSGHSGGARAFSMRTHSRSLSRSLHAEDHDAWLCLHRAQR